MDQSSKSAETAKINEIKLQFEEELKAAHSTIQLDELKTLYIGKNGLIKQLFQLFKLKTSADSSAPNYSDNKEDTGYLQEINNLLGQASQAIAQKKQEFKELAFQKKLEQEAVDITYPIRPENYGKAHPLNQTIEAAIMIFNAMGFQHVEGPEIEDEYHVFDALNTPAHHPARQMQDSFYLNNGKMLRTHTSSVQIRAMEAGQAPFHIFSIGRVYRRDWDATHSPMFHQIEGLCIDENINMSNMKYCLTTFLQNFFKEPVETRMRPSYFPFTTPSAEMDLKHLKGGTNNKGKWLEVLGCGMAHPQVLKNVNIDPQKYQGFAFGIGIERLTMIKNNIQDLRECYNNDLRWLELYGSSC